MEDLRNPFIMKYCQELLKKKGLDPALEDMAEKVDGMYCNFENLLGKNMVDALPSDKRSEYLAQQKENEVDFERIGRIFEENISNPDEILKKTMKGFAEIFSNSE